MSGMGLWCARWLVLAAVLWLVALPPALAAPAVSTAVYLGYLTHAAALPANGDAYESGGGAVGLDVQVRWESDWSLGVLYGFSVSGQLEGAPAGYRAFTDRMAVQARRWWGDTFAGLELALHNEEIFLRSGGLSAVLHRRQGRGYGVHLGHEWERIFALVQVDRVALKDGTPVSSFGLLVGARFPRHER